MISVLAEINCQNESLERAKKEILKSTGGEFPVMLDPFSGGGALRVISG